MLSWRWFETSLPWGGALQRQSAEFVWPYFAERLPLIEKALGWTPSDEVFRRKYMVATYRTNAWRALATFPVPPPALLDRMWEVALGPSKTERPLAWQALVRAPNRDARFQGFLSSGQQDQRAQAAEWIGRLEVTALVPALRSAIAKEKHDAPKAAMIGALEKLGVPPDEFLERGRLLKVSRAFATKPQPAAIAWFPLAHLPLVHWDDNRERVAPEIIQAWLIQACKSKQPEPNALLRRYAVSLVPAEREALGQFVLEAWLAEDQKGSDRATAEPRARAQAHTNFGLVQQYPQSTRWMIAVLQRSLT